MTGGAEEIRNRTVVVVSKNTGLAAVRAVGLLAEPVLTQILNLLLCARVGISKRSVK